MVSWRERYSERAQGMSASEIREILKVVNEPGMISFAGGIPAPQLFPYEEIEEAYHQLFRDITKRAEALQYSISEGYPPLRDWIVEGLRKQGLQAERHHVFIVNGS